MASNNLGRGTPLLRPTCVVAGKVTSVPSESATWVLLGKVTVVASGRMKVDVPDVIWVPLEKDTGMLPGRVTWSAGEIVEGVPSKSVTEVPFGMVTTVPSLKVRGAPAR